MMVALLIKVLILIYVVFSIKIIADKIEFRVIGVLASCL